MHDSFRYVPILLDKRAEFGALASMERSLQEGTLPLIQFRHPEPSQKAPPNWDPLNTLLSRIQDPNNGLIGTWGYSAPVLVDFGLVREQEFDRSPLQELYQRCGDVGLSAIPVTGRDRSAEQRAAAARAARTLGRGACIRIIKDDLGVGMDGLRHVVQEMDLPRESIDVMFDLGDLPIDSAFLLSKVVAQCIAGFQPLERWRSVIVAGASFPPSLSAVVEHNSYALLPRIEEALWQRVRSELGSQSLTYADYGVVSAGQQPAFRGAANLRYSMPDQWFIERGYPADKAPREDFLTLAGNLMSQETVWRGGSHCAGCAGIEERLSRQQPSNATAWRESGFAHHFAVVAESIGMR